MKLATTACLQAKSLIIALLALLFVTCGSDDPEPNPTPETFDVTFQANNGSQTVSQTVATGKTASKPTDPTREGYTFEGWFTDDNTFQKAFDFENTPITGDITLYAKWEQETAPTTSYKVAFVLNGGEGTIDTLTVEDGQNASEPDDPTRNGYTFDGWFTDDDTFQKAFDFDNTPITGDITLYAKWEQETAPTTSYKVAFVLNGGEGAIDTLTVEDGQTASEPDDPTRNGYTFEGWFTDNNTLQNAFDFDNTPITGDTTLYAKWDVATYKVAFVLNGGTGTIDALTVEHGQTASKPTDPTREGYTFEGWFTDDNTFQNAFDFENTPITGAITLYARWEVITYKVTFNLNGGTGAIDTLTVEHGKNASKPNDPTREGYTFEGWFTDDNTFQNAFDFDNTPITGDTTLYAKWDVATYKVAFVLNGGTGTIDTLTVEHGKTASKPNDPTRGAYTFQGWHSDAALQNAFTFNTPITGDITLYAKWNVVTYIVKFELNGGAGNIEPIAVEKDKTVAKPDDPTRDGYTFEGWHNDAALQNAFVFTTPITGETTLYAKWEIITYTVRFELNGGSPNIASQTVDHGNTANKPDDPTRDGYTFEGWYSDAALQNAFTFNTPVTSDVALYAKWEIITHTVRFELNGGSPNIAAQTIDDGQTADKPDDPTRNGYTFEGWHSDAALQNAFVFTTPITGETTLYAKWEIITYTVRFELNGGNPNIASQTVDHGNTANKPDDPTRDGYTFEGWHNDAALQNAFVFTTPITGETTLYAKWEIITYTVRFELNGGSPNIAAQTVDHGNTASKPNDPTRDTYNFEAWFTDDSVFQNAFDFDNTTITGDVTLYAKWVSQPGYHTVTFETGEGSEVMDARVRTGETIMAPNPPPTRVGYDLVNWYSDPAFRRNFVFDFNTPINADITLYARWNPKSVPGLFFISDDNFRMAIKNVLGDGAFDDLDRLRTQSPEVTTRTKLLLNRADITDLTGIAYFTSLTELSCFSNGLTELDISQNPNLISLDCNDNDLTTLDVRQNPNLTNLDCSNNNLTSLDLSRNTNLEVLVCSTNDLANLDVSANTELYSLNCSFNPLTSLDLSQNTDLSELSCSNIQVGRLDLSIHTALTRLSCASVSLVELDMRGMRSVSINILSIVSRLPGTKLATVRVHEDVKNEDGLKEAKTVRGDALTISTYSAAAGSTAYTSVCGDYNPNTGSCADTP